MKSDEVRSWLAEHKLRAVGFGGNDGWMVGNFFSFVSSGTLWAASLLGSLAYNFSKPNMKASVKLIHARLHAQALTLAALAGSALVEFYDHKSGAKAKRYEKHI